MKKIINTVTVTGADDNTDIDKLIALGKKYPYVEFAILLSRNSAGSTRYPSMDWIKEFFVKIYEEFLTSRFMLATSGHLCGGLVREILLGDMTDDLTKILKLPFDRWQINTHGIKHKIDIERFFAVLNAINKKLQTVIFQVDGENQNIINVCQDGGFVNISALFDLSSGRGILPSEWPKPIESIPCGYAGGLSPDNVGAELDKIENLVDNIWIDAETHLRNLQTDHFDLDLVEQFLINVKDRVFDSHIQ